MRRKFRGKFLMQPQILRENLFSSFFPLTDGIIEKFLYFVFLNFVIFVQVRTNYITVLSNNSSLDPSIVPSQTLTKEGFRLIQFIHFITSWIIIFPQIVWLPIEPEKSCVGLKRFPCRRTKVRQFLRRRKNRSRNSLQS